MTLRHAAIRSAVCTAIAVSLGLVACGPPPKPAELSKLEDMRNDARTGEIAQMAPGAMEEADKYYKMASKEWQDSELDRAREFAWLGQVRYRTAEAKTKAQEMQAESTETREQLKEATKQAELLKLKIESTVKSIDLLEKNIAAVGDKKQAVAKSSVEQVVLSAEAEREKAKAVNAQELAGGKYNKAENVLKLAREHLAAGRFDQATENANEAKALFKTAADEARPKWQEQQSSQTAAARKTALFKAATDRFGENAFQDARGVVIVLPAAFDRGETTMFPGKRTMLKNAAEIAKEFENTAVMIEGHTQSRGSASKNLTISKSRADTARDILVQEGIKVSRMTSTGYGEEKPRYDNKDRNQRAKNDRVEIVIVPQ